MARTTYAEISHRLTDPTAKTEAAYSMDDLMAYSDFARIKDESFEADKIATFEHNCWVLDGSMSLVPANPTYLAWGVWSDSLADANGDFAANPQLEATFANVHTSAGITFTFVGDSHPRQVVISWYYGTTLLAAQTYTVDAMSYFAKRVVENYNKVSIQFIGTSVPHRRIKIAEIDYGQIKTWSRDALISAAILEEINLTSSEISVNTLSFSVHDGDDDFNMLNPSGVYAALQKKQVLTAREYVNGSLVKMGKFYLDTWKNPSAAIADFEAYDAMGLFDTITYKTSSMWSGVAAGTVFAGIFAAAGWTEYSIETGIASELVSGYIPVVTVREALHQLCFALRCSCMPNREGVIEIRRLPSSSAAKAIEKSQKFGSQSITQNSLVNSVAVTAYAFTAAASSSQLYSTTLAAGSYEIIFSQPATGLTISGGTITASGINYARITVPAAGTVTISGYAYEASEAVYTYEASGLTDNTRSQATVDGIYLVSGNKAVALAQFLYEDYRRRIVQSFSLALEDEKVGDNANVDTMLGTRKSGVITKLDINLTGGFIADCEVRG